MAVNHVTITKKDLARGIDAFSARSNVQDGFAEELINVDTNSTGKLTTRPGYEGYLGWVPLRVESLDQDGTKITFKIDSAQNIDFSEVTKGPLLALGENSQGETGSDLTNSWHYYPSFVVENTDELTAGSGTLNKEATALGYSSEDYWVTLLEKTSEANTSNEKLLMDELRLDSTSYNLEVDYTVLADTTVYTATFDVTPEAGVASKHPIVNASSGATFDHTLDELTTIAGFWDVGEAFKLSSTGSLPAGLAEDTLYYIISKVGTEYQFSTEPNGTAVDFTDNGSGAITMTKRGYKVGAGTHNLNTFNLMYKVYDQNINPGYNTEVIPKKAFIDLSGNFVVVFDNEVVGNLHLYAAPVNRSVAETFSPGTTVFEINNPGSPFNFVAGYVYNTSSNVYESVMVDAIEYDAVNDKLVIDYTAPAGITSENVEFHWTNATVVSNCISVEATVGSATYEDETPRVTLWGIDHDGIYRDSTARGGHVTHLDAYTKRGVTDTVCGLGGNLYKDDLYSDSTDGKGLGYIDLRVRIDTDQSLAPLFHTTDPSPAVERTRGLIYDANVRDNKALVTDVSWDLPTGKTKYTLSFDAPSDTLAFNGQINGEDILEISGCPNYRHNGSFEITDVDNTNPNNPIVLVTNTSISSARYDSSSLLARAGVFTDRILCESEPPFIQDDILNSNFGTSAPELTINSVSGNYAYVRGVTSYVSAPDGLFLYGKRTASVAALRTAQGTPAVQNFVTGDMLTVSTLDRKVRVKYVNAQADNAVTLITGDGTTATLTTTSDHNLNLGQQVIIQNASDQDLNGIHEVVGLETATKFSVTSTVTAGTATVKGYTVELDEALTLTDGGSADSMNVSGRWLPIEAPTSTINDLVENFYERYFTFNDYDQQADLKSTTIQDSMYFTNGDDEVYKFDGNNLFRAGLPRWQAGLFTAADTTAAAGAKIPESVKVGYTAVDTAARTFQVDSLIFSVGDLVEEDGVGQPQPFTVTKVVTKDDGAGASTYFVECAGDDLSGATATGNLIRASFYKYYARLNYVDQNNNRIASAPVQADDLKIAHTDAAQLQIKLVGMPLFDAYDYDYLELELYRTDRSGTGPYYLHTREVLNFNAGAGYVMVLDSLEDALIAGLNNIDTVSNAVYGGVELGTTWSDPPLAKSLTAVSDRLILGNIKSYPQMEIVYKPESGKASLDISDISGKTFLFRKDNTDTATDSNMTNRAGYQFLHSGAITIDPDPVGADDIGTTTTSFTINSTAHGLLAGSWVYLFHSTEGVDKDLTFAGWWQIASVTTDSFTINYSTHGRTTSGGKATDVDSYLKPGVGYETYIPVWVGTDGNYRQLDYNSDTDDLDFVYSSRLAQAINSSMRVTDTGVATDFKPWLKAEAGNSYKLGQVIVTVPVTLSTTPEVRLGIDNGANTQQFVNDIIRYINEEIDFEVNRFPARLVRSYENYPEVFDNVFAPSQIDSDSVIDVNSADGQEITAIVPFFGESATGSNTRLNQELLVFKTSSIYVVNVNTREVKKLDSRGQGCTAPKSPTVTQDGVFFVNESGIYRVGRDLRIRRVGSFLERKWDSVNLAAVSECAGHHYNGGRRYKLSFPSVGTNYADGIYVYDYEREGQGQKFGAWTEYTNHDVVWWSNQAQESYWASQHGDVFRVRNLGEASDFRDDDQTISATITLKAEDFGVPALRKTVAGVTTLFDLEITDITEVDISTSMNLSKTFNSSGAVSVTRGDSDHQTVETPLVNSRGVQCQVRYQHAVKDEQLVLSGVSYRVGQLTNRLIKDIGEV